MTQTAARQAPPATLLLGRAEFCDDLNRAADFIRDRRVLVTGAAGSVGSPLSAVLVQAQPASLTLVDHHEHSLFSLERALGPASDRLNYELVDIRHRQRVERLVSQYRPEVVIHLAAAKHVPYGERFPEGAVETNVLALRHLLEVAAASGVERFVYPSSDKSVEPPSVYGATKRLAEALVQTIARVDRPWSIVRYVNIIGTRGSVIETFSLQVQSGQSLSVTDERMTRYWISMDEAVWCVLQAGRLGAPGEIVMPMCGAAVPVLSTAERLAGWYRPDRVPYPIRQVGIRPGERLHEVLLSANETCVDGPSAGLHSVRTRRDPRTLAGVAAVIDDLASLAATGDRVGLRRLGLDAARALQ